MKKKGYIEGMRFGDNILNSRDEDYVRGLLKLRSVQATQDWEEARETSRKRRGS